MLSRNIIDRLTQYEVKYKFIAPYLGTNVLDIGCGNGSLFPFLSESASYTGIDVNKDSIEALKLKYPHYSFYRLDLDKDVLPPLDNVPFSSIVLSAVIEHLENPASIIEQCQVLMNNDTKLIVTTPTGLGDLFSRIIERVLFRSNSSKDVHPHLRHYNRSELILMGETNHLKCINFRYLGWHHQNQLAVYTKATDEVCVD